MTNKSNLTRDLSTVGRGIIVIEHKTNPSVQLGVTIVNGVLKRSDIISVLNNTIEKEEWFRFRCCVQPKSETETNPEDLVFVPISDFDAGEVVFVDDWPSHDENMPRQAWIHDYLSHLQSKQMLRPGSHPFWRAHLAYTPDGEQTIFSLRIHHCIADGFTAGTFLADLMENVDPQKDIVEFTRKYNEKMHVKSEILRKLRVLGIFVWMFVGWICVIFKAIKLAFAAQPPELFRRELSETKCVGYDMTTISLSEVHRLRKKAGATVNDFYLAIITCMIRDLVRRFTEVDGIPERSLPEIPRTMPLTIPVNLRPMTGQFGYMGNHIGVTQLYAPVDPTLSFLGTLRAVKSQMDFNKAIPEALVSYQLNSLVWLFPLWMGKGLADGAAEKMAFGFSNIMARFGDKPSLCGCEVVTVCPFMPPAYPQSLGLVLCTWNDNACFSVNVDENVFGRNGAAIVLEAYKRAVQLARFELGDDAISLTTS